MLRRSTSPSSTRTSPWSNTWSAGEPMWRRLEPPACTWGRGQGDSFITVRVLRVHPGRATVSGPVFSWKVRTWSDTSIKLKRDLFGPCSDHQNLWHPRDEGLQDQDPQHPHLRPPTRPGPEEGRWTELNLRLIMFYSYWRLSPPAADSGKKLKDRITADPWGPLGVTGGHWGPLGAPDCFYTKYNLRVFLLNR